MFSEKREAESNKFKWLDLSKNRSKYLRYLYTFCSIIVVLIVIIIIIIFCTKKDEKIPSATSFKINTAEMMSDFSGKIFFTINDTKIMKYDHNTGELDLVLEASESSVIAAFIVHEDNGIHWTDRNASRIVYQSTKDVKVLLEESRFTPEGLDYDRISENIYVVDETAGTLIAISIRNGHYAILLTDLVSALDVVLDSAEGLMFILQHSHSILRANMDGSETVEIISNSGITALTIDTNRKRIYWINNFVSIESSNYDGEKRQSVFTDAVEIASIMILDDHLFWTWANQQSTVLLSCKFDSDDTCKENATHEIDATGKVKSIRGYATVASSTSNSCQVDNGGCEDICLPRGKNRSTCACRMGWELDADQSSCHEVRDFVLYPYGDVVRTCSLDGKQEIFWPTPYKVKSLDVKAEIDFDYDSTNEYFYFTDDHHIHRMKLKSYAGQEIVLSIDSTDMIIEDIAYDWLTGNMYFGQRHVNASLKHSLMVFNLRLGAEYRKTLEAFEDDHMKARSYAMALHPAKGYLFVAVTHQDNSMDTDIYRVIVNGTESRRTYHFFADGVQDHRFFTIDYAADRLYEIERTLDTTFVAYTSIESSDMKFTDEVNVMHARTVGVYQQWLYLSNFSSVWRFDETRKNGIKIGPRIEDATKKIVGVRVISGEVLTTGGTGVKINPRIEDSTKEIDGQEAQFTDSDNPCAINNGGCEQFCFAGSKATCECKDGQEVKSDGRCN